jgi:hypothetical protein
MAKTTLTVIDPTSKPNPLAPRPELGEAGRRLWGDVHSDFEILDAGGLEMLHQICSAADRASEYAETITRDGGPAVRVKGGGIREHPLVRHELAARSFVVRSLHRLGLDVVAPRTEIGRPAGAYRGEDR